MSPSNRNLVAGSLGSILEWYDFAVYGYFAPVIATLFFPADDRITSLLATFGVFAVGFVARPAGSFIFGHLGDRTGRTKMMAASILAMSLPTALIGLLPTHAQIGVAAPIALTLLRVAQGLSVGGEMPGSVVFLVEQAPREKWDLPGAGPWSAYGAASCWARVSELCSARFSLPRMSRASPGVFRSSWSKLSRCVS